MSRIDEALRRARAARDTRSETGVPELHAVESPVVASWQYERLPSEDPRQPETERLAFSRPAQPPAAGRRPVAAPPQADAVPVLPSAGGGSVASDPLPQRPVEPAQSPRGIRYIPGGVAPEFMEKLVVGGGSAAASREQYRRLAASLHQAQQQRRVTVVMVASAVAGEGKTLTAANLALTLSESYGRRVLLVDADLRRPALHDLFQVSNARGLVDGLQAGSDYPLPLIEFSTHLSVLPAGEPQPDPMRLLISSRMREVLAEAAVAFDWVIVDTPPIGIVPDAHLLGDMAHAAVLVVKAGSTPHELTAAAAAALGREKIHGVVLNCVDEQEVAGSYERYGYGYASGRP